MYFQAVYTAICFDSSNCCTSVLGYNTAGCKPLKQLYCCVVQATQKTSHVMAILPVHWRALTIA
jgi:hypothetical protein